MKNTINLSIILSDNLFIFMTYYAHQPKGYSIWDPEGGGMEKIVNQPHIF